MILALLLAAFTPEEDLRYLKDYAETRGFSLGKAVSPQFLPDGSQLLFLRAQPRNPELRLYAMELATKTMREVMSPEQILAGAAETMTAEEKAMRERTRMTLKGITSFQVA